MTSEAQPPSDAPPPPLPGQFWLKTAPLPGTEPSRFTGLYLRQNSNADPAVVLTPAPPKFLRAQCDPAGSNVHLVSWKHGERRWGLVLRAHPAGKAGWERVEIPDDEIDVRVSLAKDAQARETLQGRESDGWRGWMVCEWSLGHPQLFWVTGALQSNLPPFCERVAIIREML